MEGGSEPLPPSQGQSFPSGPCLPQGSEATTAQRGGTFQHHMGNGVHSGDPDLEGDRVWHRKTHEEPDWYFQLSTALAIVSVQLPIKKKQFPVKKAFLKVGVVFFSKSLPTSFAQLDLII